MSDGTWELAAHKVGTAHPTKRYIVKLNNGLGAEYNQATPTSLPSLVNVFVPPTTAPHFPYGRVVDAD